jgi:3-deoxy-D-manno-octulosonate 8-phosphate phosphatase (KDO 8-P phosphatase)
LPEEFIDIIQGSLKVDPDVFIQKLRNVKALVFDWDGIFNDGRKGQIPSSFSEIDSMGINMLRFGYYLLHEKNPYTAIATGEKNDTALHWAEREHIHSVFFRLKNKADILETLEREHSILPEEILFVFDDIHDLSLARKCGVRILVRNPGARLFVQYCEEMGYCDYIPKNDGNNNALREISEIILAALGLFKRTIILRMEFKGIYEEYLETRNLVKTYIKEMK